MLIVYLFSIATRNYVTDEKKTLPWVWGATPSEANEMCLLANSLGEEVYILLVGTGTGRERDRGRGINYYL